MAPLPPRPDFITAPDGRILPVPFRFPMSRLCLTYRIKARQSQHAVCEEDFVAPKDQVAAATDVLSVSAETIYWTASKFFRIASKCTNIGLSFKIMQECFRRVSEVVSRISRAAPIC